MLKPFDNDKLFRVIDDQANDILLRRSMLEEEIKRKLAEESLKRNEGILQAVSDAAEILLRGGYNTETVKTILHKLGIATQVSRVYIFENRIKNNEIYASHTHEWVQYGISKQIDNSKLQNVNLSDSPFKRWNDTLSKRELIFGHIKNFPADERPDLEMQDIISIMVVPIFVDNLWFGFMG